MSPNDSSVFWTDSIDYLKHVNISYVYKIIEKSTELNQELIEELKVRFESESAEMPFCNLGDVDLDDLENDLPEGWTLRREKTDLKPGEAMVVLAVIDYSAERYFVLGDTNLASFHAKRSKNKLKDNGPLLMRAEDIIIDSENKQKWKRRCPV